VFPAAPAGLSLALGCGGMGAWMLWSSKVGKLRERETLLNHLAWTGRERVLDVGCGRGLMLIGAAKRLTTGRATGIDIWQQEDLSGNSTEATQRNAACEGVADRVELQTADMRTLPFGDATFDVVVSKAAIHNIYAAEGRAQAIAEIVRVLKPGGHALIDDIRHHGEYLAAFAAHGCPDARELSSPAMRALLFLLTFGSLRPAVLLVTKS
jgi:ubiquinone/menaquinone biosynthesis C-methylase UbiE